MPPEMPQVPAGSGRHAIPMVAVAANDLAAATVFDTALLGCGSMPMGPGLAATLARIGASGGARIGEPLAMPGLATFRDFKDPSGTTLGLIGPSA